MTKLGLGTHPFLLGFEQLERLVERTAKSGGEGYPPYNIEATAENAYRITLAVAGFREDDLSITVEDEVTNESFRDEPLMWMYHCNFGWPLLAEGAEVVIPSRKATPRDETTAADPTPWNEIQAPEANRPESVYLHELAADDHGRSFAAVVNRKLGLGVVIDFDASLFPYFMEWKSMGAGDYVVGLEPSNSSVQGRGWHEQRGDLHTLAPQGTERKSLTFTVIEGAEAIDALIARRDTLLG